MVKLILKKHSRLLLVTLCALMASANLYAYDFKKDGIYYDINDDGTSVSVTYGSSKYTGDVTIPSTVTDEKKTYSVTSIADSAFNECIGLTNITIPNSVTSIGDQAFARCSKLTRIAIPNSVTSIGGQAFARCSKLASLDIPNSIASIGSDAFFNTLWYSNQPEGLVYIGLIAYKYKGAMPESTSIFIKEGTKGITGGAFSNCLGLTSINIPNSVTSIGDQAFFFCSELTSITIPNSVTSIGIGAFFYCAKLTNISIPSSVTSIRDYAFSSCSRVTELHICSITPPTLGSNAFDEITNCTLYVPTNSVNAYKSSDWAEYPWVNIIGEETGISQTISNNNENSISFDLLGRQKTRISHGLTIVNGKKIIR